MVSPDDERLFRAIDEDHVDQIKEYLTHRKDCFTILIGNLTSFESVEEIDKDDLTQPNKFKIETLGGNHTRKAIQELLEADEDRFGHYSIIQCKLFANLPTIDALMLGFDHNLSNEYGKQTSAEDLLKLCRKELKNICQDHNTTIDNCPAKISKLWHKKLCHIFGLNTTPRDLHNRYKIILSLAKSSEDVWIQLRTLFERFNARELKYQPSGILKQGHLKQLSSYTEQERFNTLKTVVEKKDWRLMKGGNNSATGKKLPDVPQNKAGIHLNEENKKLQNEKKLLAVELKEIKSQLAVNQKQAKLLSAKNVQLREIIKEKDGKIAVLEKQCEDQNEDLAFYMFSEQNKKREITEDNVVPSAICDSNSPKNLQEHSTKDNLAVDILETNKDDPQPPSTTTSKHSSLESQETDKNGDDLKHVKQADRVKVLNNSHICDLCDKKFVDDTFLAKHINQYHRILETNKETDRKRYWEYVEIDSDKAPAKAFHAVDGPRIKKNKFNFSP